MTKAAVVRGGAAVRERQSVRGIAQEPNRFGISSPSAREPWLRRLLRLLLVSFFLTIIAAPTLLPRFSVVDNDIWWHLKVGDWIIEHSGFPHSGILSRTAAERPWAAYSWFYEVLLAVFHRWLHLAGISVYGFLLALGVACSIFWMTLRLSGSFWKSCVLSTATCAASLFNVYPRPVFFSMALFTVTLTLLLEARRSGRIQLLYWLPPVFLLWANSHIQFIYGVFVLGLFVGISVLQHWASQSGLKNDSLLAYSLPPGKLAIILAACLLASCVGPYSYHLYFVIFGYVTSKFPYDAIAEFQALRFRNYTDFVQLLLMGIAFFALGRRKQRDPFLFALLVIASIVGFRMQRDSWFICIPAAACIAATVDSPKREYFNTVAEKLALAAIVAVMVFAYAKLTGFSNNDLRLAVSNVYPVQAVNFLRDYPQPGPLYNTFDWGGFLSWYMPGSPVAIDGRTDLYGDEIDYRFFRTENGDPSYLEDPYLNEANLILLPKQRPIALVLASDSRFHLIYEDSLSVVFIRK